LSLAQIETEPGQSSPSPPLWEHCFQAGFVMEEMTRLWFDGLAAGRRWADRAALGRTWWVARQAAAADPCALTGPHLPPPLTG